MWRVLAAGLLFMGCGDGSSSTSTSDAAILRTSPFQPLQCTSGSPGDSTCPYNVVSLDSLGGPSGAALEFTLQSINSKPIVDHFELKGAGPVHIDGLWLDEMEPTGGRTFIADSLDLGMTVGPIELEGFSPGPHELVVRVDAIH